MRIVTVAGFFGNMMGKSYTDWLQKNCGTMGGTTWWMATQHLPADVKYDIDLPGPCFIIMDDEVAVLFKLKFGL